MCTSPVILLKRNSERCDMVTSLNYVRNDSNFVFKRLRPHGDDFLYSKHVVPCGKCAECLGKRQSDLAARCALEARKRGSMCFVTLTYRDDTLPIACLLEEVDIETGEVSSFQSLSSLPRPRLSRSKSDKEKYGHFLPMVSEHDECLRGFSHCGYRQIKYFERDVVFDEVSGVLYRYHFTPSLCFRDVRLWLKRARVKYEREYGSKLPEFTYVVCGEYGSITHRPHYHLGFFGLQKKHVDFLCSLWFYGFTYVQQVNCVNEDGSDGFAAASKYIGKYMSKGQFECESVKCGYAVKGRLASSRGLGSELSKPLVNYYRCYDVLGEYDINKPLSNDNLQKLLELLSKRATITVGNSVYVLPRKFIRQIWYVQRSDKTFSASVVRRQISSALQCDCFNNYVRDFTERFPGLPRSEIIKMALNEQELFRISALFKDSSRKLRYQKFYLTSKF